MVKNNYRTAAKEKYVAAATRRRRRILSAEFFFKGGNMTERERMISGKLYNPYMISDNLWAEIRAACKKFNEYDFWSDRSA